MAVDRAAVEEAHVVGPELVAGVTGGRSQALDDGGGRKRVGVGRLRHDPHATVLRDRTGGPAVVGDVECGSHASDANASAARFKGGPPWRVWGAASPIRFRRANLESFPRSVEAYEQPPQDVPADEQVRPPGGQRLDAGELHRFD